MTDPTQKRKTVTVAALVVVGMLAGVLVATSGASEEFATIGTIADDDQAYAVSLSDERVQFQIVPDEGATDPQVQFTLYDPEDAFFGAFELSGAEDHTQLLADRPGHWVVFVTQAREASLAVQVEDEGENTTRDLVPLDVRTVEKSVVTKDGGAVDTELALRLAQRPAAALLTVEGSVSGLDAVVETDKGTVFSVTDASKNETHNTLSVQQAKVTPENLMAGAYRIQAQADALEGKLLFVYETYDRGDLVDHRPVVDPPIPDLPEGAVIAELEEDEPVLVDSQGVETLLLSVDRDADGTVKVFNSSDQLVEIVDIDGDHDWSWSHDDHSRDENTSDARLIEVPLEEPGEYVLYASYLSGADVITVMLPGVEEAERGHTLDVEKVEFELAHDNGTANATAELPGGLLGASIWTEGVLVETDRTTTVESPLGIVFETQQNLNTLGANWWYGDYEYNPENITSGLYTVTTESDDPMPLTGGQGTTHVVLHHYVR